MTYKDSSGLSDNEKLILYNLVKYPSSPDHEIYERLGIRQSTYSTIKKKLAQNGYYHTAYDPILQHMGYELMAVWYVTLNRRTSTDERLSVTRDALVETPDLITVLSESNQALILSFSRNIAEHVKVTDDLVRLYEKHDFLDSLHQVLFPFEVSCVFSFFDFAPLLNRIFRLEPPEDCIGDVEPGSASVMCSIKSAELNELEKRAYLALIRNPSLSDSQISEKLDCSRQVFTRMKYRFIEEQLIKKRRIVSLERLGFKMLSMTHTKFNPLKPLSERGECAQKAMTCLAPFLKIARDPECVMLNAFMDFEEHKALHNEYAHFCTNRNLITGEPVGVLLSIPRLYEIKWLVYQPLVRKVLSEI